MFSPHESQFVAAQLPHKGAGIPYMAPASNRTGKDDPMYAAAVEVVRKLHLASISMVQLHLRIRYNRAAYMVEAMEGTVVSKPDGVGARQVLPFNERA